MSYDTKHLGKWGEMTAENYLIDKGCKILERNYRTAIGELDIVAQKNGVLIFIEVKTRDSVHASNFLPEESITPRKKSKLKKLCEMYINDHGYGSDQEWRIDVISIILDKSAQKARINHIENAVYG